MPAALEENDAVLPLLGDSDSDRGKRRSTLLTVCPFILGNEFCERLAYYGLSTNLVVYLTDVMGEKPAYASMQVSIMSGTCYLTPLLGAWLADAKWGRYKTIIIFSVIYLMGMVLLTMSATLDGWAPAPGAKTSTRIQNIVLYGALYIVALGTGGIKPNVSAFGADQFDESDPKDKAEKRSFFNWFYFFINLGSLLAVTVVVYVQENIGWRFGFGIPTLAMALAIVAFMGGSPLYTHVQPTESPMARLVNVVSAALKGLRKERRVAELASREGLEAATPIGMPRTGSYQWLDCAIDESAERRSILSGARTSGFSRRQVEEVRMVLRMLPIFFTTILYWTIYAQMGSFFVQQGQSMDRRVSGTSVRIPAASLAVFNTVSIIVLIPLYDRGLIPILRRCGRSLSHLQRIGWGLVVCVFAMLAAALVERWRLMEVEAGNVWDCETGGEPRKHFRVCAGVSVFWQAPQYLLIGLSEVLASIGQLEFFYDQAPDVMRSNSMALQLLSVAVGSYLAGAVVSAASSLTRYDPAGAGWLPDDLDKGHLDYYFLVLAGMMVVNTIIFVWVAVEYEYKAVAHIPTRLPTSGKPPLAPRGAPSSPTRFAAGFPTRTEEITIGGMRRGAVDPSIYGRSVTFIPESPALPAPFR